VSEPHPEHDIIKSWQKSSYSLKPYWNMT